MRKIAIRLLQKKIVKEGKEGEHLGTNQMTQTIEFLFWVNWIFILFFSYLKVVFLKYRSYGVIHERKKE